MSNCTLPGCTRPNQITSGNGHSRRYCKHHVEFNRRHGSMWFRSFTAADLEPHRKAVRSWLRRNSNDMRVKYAISAIAGMMEGAGPSESAYNLRGKPAQDRANVALARLRKAQTDPLVILERILAVQLCCEARGIDERQREFRQVQMAKSVHRLASGTHRTPSGFPLPAKYPRSEGKVLRLLGLRLDDIASFALNDRNVAEEHSHE